MRLILTTHDAGQARTLANFLSGEGIENQLEMVKGSDWSQTDYGDAQFRLWVYDEDKAEEAEKWLEAFEKDPKNPMFQKSGVAATVIPSILQGKNQEGKNVKFIDLVNAAGNANPQSPAFKPEAYRSVTMSILILCCLFYLINGLTSPHVTSLPNNIPPIPIVSAPIKKQLLYDYPRPYQLVDKLVKLYGIEKLQSPETLPPEGQYILKEVHRTPQWEGFYATLMARSKNMEIENSEAPLFEKIREGEVWRLFTPALMHTDFLHILFNMIWLIVLGKQLEVRLNARRYILFILIVGIISNTCQYLMGGPNFIGFSGVICGMATFIWIRQKIAPWEGYPLESNQSLFIIYFISVLFLIQIVSFYLEANHNYSISPGIANTAHITGALTGIALAFLPFFKKSIKSTGPNS